MTESRCLITGADFLDPDEQRWIHGDLHQIDTCMVFVYADKQEWIDALKTPLGENSKAIKCGDFFEQNNVIVFPLFACEFNQNANEYLNKVLNQEGVPFVLMDPKGGFIQ